MPFDSLYLKMNTNFIFSVVTKIFELIPIFFFSNRIQLLLKFFNNRSVNVYLFTSFLPLKENLGFSLLEFFYLLLWYFFSSFFFAPGSEFLVSTSAMITSLYFYFNESILDNLSQILIHFNKCI